VGGARAGGGGGGGGRCATGAAVRCHRNSLLTGLRCARPRRRNGVRTLYECELFWEHRAKQIRQDLAGGCVCGGGVCLPLQPLCPLRLATAAASSRALAGSLTKLSAAAVVPAAGTTTTAANAASTPATMASSSGRVRKVGAGAAAHLRCRAGNTPGSEHARGGGGGVLVCVEAVGWMLTSNPNGRLLKQGS
jgi:hypothetical protein